MAAPRKSRGFTLVELLVVITIIGMLVSLLLPAIQAAREAGRRTTCMNNMRQAGTGLTLVEQSKKAFPGYVSLIQKSAGNIPVVRASWVVPVLPSLEQNALFQNWMNPALAVQWNQSMPGINKDQYITQLSILICPSNANPDLNDDSLSFVVNTGIAVTANDNPPSSSAPTWPEDSASGVFFNQSQLDITDATKRTPQKKVNMDYITSNDGSNYTLLLSENLQAGRWATDAVGGPNVPFTSDFAVRQNTGFVWFLTGQQNNSTPPTMTLLSGYNPLSIGINDLAQVVSGQPKSTWNSMNTSEPTGLAYARPSGNHPSGVNAMCAGGNARFLSEEMDYKVFTQLMTPVQNKVIVDYEMGLPVRTNRGSINSPAATTGANKVIVPWRYILNEADL